MLTVGSDANEFHLIADGILPHNFFGDGPFSLDQLIPVTETSFITFTPSVFLSQNTTGLTASGDITSWSATVIPEPSGVVLVSLGLLTLGGAAYRKRKKKQPEQNAITA